MLNTMMENEGKSFYFHLFSEILVADHDINFHFILHNNI